MASTLTFGSPIKRSTPGGIESGVLPSLDDLFAVTEKGLDESRVGWNAGTRKLGRVMADAGNEEVKRRAPSRALLRLGANIGGSYENYLEFSPCSSSFASFEKA